MSSLLEDVSIGSGGEGNRMPADAPSVAVCFTLVAVRRRVAPPPDRRCWNGLACARPPFFHASQGRTLMTSGTPERLRRVGRSWHAQRRRGCATLAVLVSRLGAPLCGRGEAAFSALCSIGPMGWAKVGSNPALPPVSLPATSGKVRFPRRFPSGNPCR